MRDRTPQAYKAGARHGTYGAYSSGCRCDQCRQAASDYWRAKRQGIKRHTPQPVPFAPLLERIACHVGCAPGDLTGEVIAEVCDVDRRTVVRWFETGLVRHRTTDRVAVALGWHPAAIWGADWYLAGITEAVA